MDELARRQFLERAAKASAVGALVWVTPSVVSVQRADAASIGSLPPRTVAPPPPLPEVPDAPPADMGPPLPEGLPGVLAFTGAEAERNAKVGVSALAAGAALWYLGHEGRSVDESR